MKTRTTISKFGTEFHRHGDQLTITPKDSGSPFTITKTETVYEVSFRFQGMPELVIYGGMKAVPSMKQAMSQIPDAVDIHRKFMDMDHKKQTKH